MAWQLVGARVLVFAIRHLYHQIHTLELVEIFAKPNRSQSDELGRRHCVCFGAGVFFVSLRGSKLPNSIILIGENAPHRRLSLGE